MAVNRIYWCIIEKVSYILRAPWSNCLCNMYSSCVRNAQSDHKHAHGFLFFCWLAACLFFFPPLSFFFGTCCVFLDGRQAPACPPRARRDRWLSGFSSLSASTSQFKLPVLNGWGYYTVPSREKRSSFILLFLCLWSKSVIFVKMTTNKWTTGSVSCKLSALKPWNCRILLPDCRSSSSMLTIVLSGQRFSRPL